MHHTSLLICGWSVAMAQKLEWKNGSKTQRKTTTFDCKITWRLLKVNTRVTCHGTRATTKDASMQTSGKVESCGGLWNILCQCACLGGGAERPHSSLERSAFNTMGGLLKEVHLRKTWRSAVQGSACPKTWRCLPAEHLLTRRTTEKKGHVFLRLGAVCVER